jgi:curli production assembly/transport component CsgG/holdfast attachment protein HfaB
VLGGSRFVMNVAVDLRLVDSISQEVVAIAAYQKQIVGREIRAGVFDIFGGVAVDLSGGQSALEPLQLGVRALIERGVYDVAAELYGLTDSACLPPVQTADTAGGYRLLRSLQSPVTERPAQAFAAAPVPAPTRVPAAPPVRSGVPLASPLILPLPVSAGDPAVPAAAVPAEGTPARPRIDPRTWRVTRGG